MIHTTKEGAVATISIWCRVSKVSEYLIGHSFESIAFDLYSIDMGKMAIYEYYFDSTSNGQSIYLHFSVPSTMLLQSGDSYLATVNVNPLRQNTLSEDNRNIFIVIPSDSEVESINPSSSGDLQKNIATFILSANSHLPVSFTVTSEPHVPTFNEMVHANFTSPNRIIVIAGVATVLISGFQGMNLLKRRRTYNRTAKLIAKIFHDYIRPHEALKGKTPAEACGVEVK